MAFKVKVTGCESVRKLTESLFLVLDEVLGGVEKPFGVNSVPNLSTRDGFELVSAITLIGAMALNNTIAVSAARTKILLIVLIVFMTVPKPP
ncbi:MAG: hypothetical protein HND47_19950 [Chloroflexi bacterium]|nr:hypothetical protein [Chloroflexota bacterium]